MVGKRREEITASVLQGQQIQEEAFFGIFENEETKSTRSFS